MVTASTSGILDIQNPRLDQQKKLKWIRGDSSMFNKNDQVMVNLLARRICEGRGYDPDLHWEDFVKDAESSLEVIERMLEKDDGDTE